MAGWVDILRSKIIAELRDSLAQSNPQSQPEFLDHLSKTKSVIVPRSIEYHSTSLYLTYLVYGNPTCDHLESFYCFLKRRAEDSTPQVTNITPTTYQVLWLPPGFDKPELAFHLDITPPTPSSVLNHSKVTILTISPYAKKLLPLYTQLLQSKY